MQKIKAITFDGDGVVLNSIETHFLAFQKTANDFGFEMNRDDFENCFNGLRAEDGIVQYNKIQGTNIDPEEFRKTKLKYTQKALEQEMRFFPDTLEFIERVYKGNVQLKEIGEVVENPVIGLVTMLRRPIVEMMLKQNDFLKEVFQIVVTADDCNRGKPDSEAYESFLDQAKIDPGEVVGIEDSPWGVESLNSAGIFSIAVTNTSKAEELQEADLVMEELLTLLKK